MRSTVSVDLCFSWILLAFIQLWKANGVKINNYNNSKGVMTCNCSWGSLPEFFNIWDSDGMKYKIVGGTAVKRREVYPMMAGLQVDGCMVCGASILTEYHALTAAHCFDEDHVSTMTLVVGTRRRCYEPNDGGQYIPLATQAYIHEYYDEFNNYRDIAIVVTQRKILFGAGVGPACIHTKPIVSMEDHLFILGWGKISETGEPSKELLKVFLKPLDIVNCKELLPPGFISRNTNSQLCTYSHNRDACSGDSGGPLFILDRSLNRLAQVALVSMGIGCARVGEPGINTALFPFLGWMQWTIERTMRIHHPKEFHRCGNSFCHITTPLRK